MSLLTRRVYSVTAIVLAAIVFVSLNIAAGSLLRWARIDLTENGQYTLAKGTRNIIGSLKEPITLRFFFSKKVAADYAQTSAYAKRVRDMLQQYASLADGKIILEEIDPEPFTPEEDEASANGLTPAPTESGEQVYFGLVGTNRIDGKETIAYFAPEREPFLEYDLSALVYRLETPRKPAVGIVSGIPLSSEGGMAAALQGQSQQNAIYQQLNQTWSTQTLDPNFQEIPSNLNAVVIVHPVGLTNTQLYAVDQYVLHGGHALVFVDPNSEIAQANAGEQSGPMAPSSDLQPLFKAWGIAYDPTKIIGDKTLAQRVEISSDPRNPVASYPVWIHATKDNFSSKDLVVANLQSLNLASAGSLKATPTATTTFTPLVRSSDEAALLDANEVRSNPRPQDLMSTIEPTGERYVIAARVSGSAKTAFPGGPPTATNASTPTPTSVPALAPQLRQSKEAIDVIVMADTDIFEDRFWVHVTNLFGKEIATPFADNAAFVLNAVENLTGSNDLISLRTRASNDRPFTVVRQLQAAAQTQYQQEAEMLQQRLTDTQQRLHDLEQGANVNGRAMEGNPLSPQQEIEIERFRRQLVATRSQLREVQHNLRRDIDSLGSILAFINIASMPILASLCALVVAGLRRRRRARAVTRYRSA